MPHRANNILTSSSTFFWEWFGRQREIVTSACWRTWHPKFGRCFHAGSTGTHPQRSEFLPPWDRQSAPAALHPQGLATSACCSTSQRPASNINCHCHTVMNTANVRKPTWFQSHLLTLFRTTISSLLTHSGSRSNLHYLVHLKFLSDDWLTDRQSLPSTTAVLQLWLIVSKDILPKKCEAEEVIIIHHIRNNSKVSKIWNA